MSRCAGGSRSNQTNRPDGARIGAPSPSAATLRSLVTGSRVTGSRKSIANMTRRWTRSRLGFAAISTAPRHAGDRPDRDNRRRRGPQPELIDPDRRGPEDEGGAAIEAREQAPDARQLVDRKLLHRKPDRLLEESRQRDGRGRLDGLDGIAEPAQTVARRAVPRRPGGDQIM